MRATQTSQMIKNQNNCKQIHFEVVYFEVGFFEFDLPPPPKSRHSAFDHAAMSIRHVNTPLTPSSRMPRGRSCLSLNCRAHDGYLTALVKFLIGGDGSKHRPVMFLFCLIVELVTSRTDFENSTRAEKSCLSVDTINWVNARFRVTKRNALWNRVFANLVV